MPAQQRPLHFHIEHASKSYHGVPALISAHLDLTGGEVHGLIGENGAGKSTLIKLIAGVVPADQMSIQFNDRPLHITQPSEAWHAGLRFIHQELNIVPSISVAENLYISQAIPRRAGIFVNWKRLFQQAQEVLARLGIEHIDVRETASRLRPGDAMLVKIASAFVGQTDTTGDDPALIYVMDEPTASLTSAEADLLFRVIATLKEQGCAVLYVTHRLDELAQIADRVTVMRDGRVIATHLMPDTTPELLIQEMTGRSFSNMYPPREIPIGTQIRLEVRELTSSKIQPSSMRVKAGEIVGIAGLNGSGRSEFLQALFGADSAESGEVLLDGEHLPRLQPATAWEQGIAFVPEERRSQGIIPGASISANMLLPHLDTIRLLGILLDQRREQHRAIELGQAVRLKATSTHQHIRELSGGNQQKALFGRALLRQPRVLLLDEPTRGVDVGAKFDIYRMIRELSAQGLAIVMVSSELGELIGMCDRIFIMRDRQLGASVTAAGLTEKGLLSLCYGLADVTATRDRG